MSVTPGTAEKLSLNADAPGGAITLELLDPATGLPLASFAAADCVPIVDDSLDHPVRWKNQETLPSERSTYQIRVHLAGATGDLKIYSLMFN